ncbi:sugar transferase [Bifidobacterium porcinum]|uniref:sugar transferase n=1 Tax=Bifidobacterium porcinum TaxID=212365 RepID=UPI0009DDB8BB
MPAREGSTTAVQSRGQRVQDIPAPPAAKNRPHVAVSGNSKPTSASHTARTPRQSSQSLNAETSFFDGSYFAPDEQGVLHRTSDTHPPLGYTIPRWRYVFNATLIALDTVMALLACSVMFLFNHHGYQSLLANDGQIDGVTGFLVIVCITNLFSLYICKSYERHTMGEGYELYTKLINSQLLNFIMLCSAAYIFKLDVPRTFTFLVPIITLLLLIVERWVMRQSLHRNRRNGEYNYPTVLVGSPEGIREIIANLKANNSLGYEPIAICPVASNRKTDNADSPQHLISVPFEPNTDFERKLRILPLDSHLPQAAKRLNAQTVLITDVLTRDSETMRTLSLAVESMGIELALTTKVADIGGSELRFRNNPTTPILTAKLPQYTITTRIIKRLCDLVLSFIALILLSPVMAWAAIMVKREDGGPVFYSQQRIGIYGKSFTMYKFRSMRTDADAVKAQLAKERGIEDRFIFKLKDDPRITKIGHFIRKTSIDELPQLLNVLKGDMSLVGPRPPLPEEVARYDSLYSTRLLVKPGITGAWQVSGRSDLTQEQSEVIDVSYVQNWSITEDIAILFKTVSAVLKGTGSY